MEMRRLRPILVESMQLVVQGGTMAAALGLAAWCWTKMMSSAAKLVALLAVGTILRTLQRILCPARRRSARWFVQYGAWAAFYLPIPLATYALGIMHSTPGMNVITMLVWGHSIIFSVMRHTQSMTSYRLNDTLQHGWRHAQRIGYPLYWLFIVFTACLDMEPSLKSLALIIGVSLLGSFFLIHANFQRRPVIPHTISSYCSKKLAEHMKLEAESGDPFFVSGQTILENCRYLFETGEDGERQVMMKDVLHLLDNTPEPGRGRLRRVFLSYSFFNMIKRRHYGFACAEEGNPRMREFVFNEFSAAENAGLGITAFKVVEVQLAFLYDHFFTTHSSLVYHMPLGIVQLPPIYVGVLFLCAAYLKQQDTRVVLAEPLHIVVRIGLQMYHLDDALDILQKMYYWASDWYEVWYAFQYHGDRARLYRSFNVEKLAGWLSKIRLFKHQYWQNKIGQYSLLQDYDRVSVKKRLMAWLTGLVLAERYDFISHHPLEEDPVSLPDSVKGAVFHALRQSDGSLTNGTSSLETNGASHLFSWTCSQPTHTDTILIWHVATCYCEMTGDSQNSTHYKVATSLSRYCAYLVAFLPEFLPEHSLTTTTVFQRVLTEAKELLGNASSTEEKISKIAELQLPEEEANLKTFEKGVKLGSELKDLVSTEDPELRWKVMADFWAETMLYVAPSDKVAAHINQLAKGGEFVTHLWALLSNAGILKRANN